MLCSFTHSLSPIWENGSHLGPRGQSPSSPARWKFYLGPLQEHRHMCSHMRVHARVCVCVFGGKGTERKRERLEQNKTRWARQGEQEKKGENSERMNWEQYSVYTCASLVYRKWQVQTIQGLGVWGSVHSVLQIESAEYLRYSRKASSFILKLAYPTSPASLLSVSLFLGVK